LDGTVTDQRDAATTSVKRRWQTTSRQTNADRLIGQAAQNGTKTLSSPADDGIYRQIYDAIVQHYLPPGTKLAEEALGEVFGVSRPTIRAVLIRLAHEGIVELQPNRGAFVARPSVKAARDVFAVRRTLECAMVAQLASGLDRVAMQNLRATVKAELDAQARGDRKTQLRLSGELHLQLAKFTGNEILHDILKELISRSSLAIAAYQIPGTSGCRCDDHAHLLDALAARDDATASATMREHLSNLENGLDLEPEEFETIDLKTVFSEIGAMTAGVRVPLTPST